MKEREQKFRNILKIISLCLSLFLGREVFLTKPLNILRFCSHNYLIVRYEKSIQLTNDTLAINQMNVMTKHSV